MKERKIFLGIAIAWLVIIVIFIGIKEFNITTGKEITLQTVPVDPYDMFRGDYVILRYDISEMQVPEGAYKAGDTVYVTLEEELPTGYTRGIKISREKPNDFFIKGTITNINQMTKDNTSNKNDIASIEYGIESYFIPEGKGWILEQERGKGLDAKVSVTTSGRAIIKELLINKKPIDYSQKEPNYTIIHSQPVITPTQ